MRPVVPAGEDPGRRRPDLLTAGAGGGGLVLPLHQRPDGAVADEPDLLAGIWSLLAEQLRAVPRRLIWDNEAGIGRGGRLADGVAGFSGTLATKIVQLKPFDPESKGIVERANGYLE